MTASSTVVISNLAYLIGAVVLAIIGGLLVWLRHRKPRSVVANVESFHRGLRALAPDSSPVRSRPANGPEPAPVTAQPGVRVAAPKAGGAPSGGSGGGEAGGAGSGAGEAGSRAGGAGSGSGGHHAEAEEAPAKRTGVETG